jgi:hypothetical protein
MTPPHDLLIETRPWILKLQTQGSLCHRVQKLGTRNPCRYILVPGHITADTEVYTKHMNGCKPIGVSTADLIGLNHWIQQC